MARRGRKRKVGPREPSGRIQRKTTLAQIEEMDRKQREQEMSVVLAQPHRKGDRDQRLGSAVGRYCKALGLSDDIYMACQDYATAETRWLSGWGKPKGFEQHEGGSGVGPSAEQMDKWLKRIKTVEGAVKGAYGWNVFCAVRRLVVEDADVEESPSIMKAALAQVAVALGYLENNPHPFVG